MAKYLKHMESAESGMQGKLPSGQIETSADPSIVSLSLGEILSNLKYC